MSAELSLFAEVSVFAILGNVMYLALGLVALWGAFCLVVVWTRVREKRFRNEDAQTEFLDTVDEKMVAGDYESVEEFLDGDKRAMSQLALLAVTNRDIGYGKVRQLLVDRFQRDVLADLEHRLSWVNTVIKSAPMLGLLGTVMGMMGAFAKLAAQESVKPSVLAEDISFALITTACGLAIAIPLLLAVASVNVRIRKMEDLVAAGLTRFLDSFRMGLETDESRRGE